MFSTQQVESISPNPAAYKAGQSLSSKSQWQSISQNERVIWGEIRGSGKNPYLVQLDKNALAYKCTCPSRQFPCKHSIALMLLYSASADDFVQASEEPEWVKSWIEKRQGKTAKPEVEVERTDEEQEKLDRAREKTQEDRFASVQAGALELELWLKDLVRIGILELPNKPLSEFEKVAARMVDAKANGLAGWVKSLGKLNFENQEEWQNDALTIISKLFLLIKTFQNYDQLDPKWQISVKNLVGWSQSTKELLANSEAELVKDNWLIVGQETETQDEVIIQRNWLLGCTSNRRAMILNFGTRFSAIENPPVPGKILKAELAFFPAVVPHRAVVKLQHSYSDELAKPPVFFESWQEVYKYQAEYLKLYPWATDFIILLQDSCLTRYKDKWIIYDRDKDYVPVFEPFDSKKIMKWLALSGNGKLNVALIMRYGKALPLGIFKENGYFLL